MDGDYLAFLQSKLQFAQYHGFDAVDVNPSLRPFTQDVVRWACKGGRRALFMSFGLHKTVTQIEVMRQVGIFDPGLRLIVLPLGVRAEFFADTERFFTDRYAVRLKFIRTASEIEDASIIYLTNYESVRDGKLDPRLFKAASLDEAAVLRSYGSKTYQEFLGLFDSVLYRFVATATPSPNRYKELIHYAGFLGVMDTGQALTRFFQRDSTQANNLTLYPHKTEEFFLWLHSWALFVLKPSDLGYADDGYSLPDLHTHYHELPAPEIEARADRDGQLQLVRDAALGLKEAATEKRISIVDRVARLATIIEPSQQWILWCDLNDEQRAIEQTLTAAGISFVSLYGSQDIDARDEMIGKWKRREVAVFLSKPEMYGAGVNMQQCHAMIFVGIDYSFHEFIQAVHRIQRFGQAQACDVHVIYTETEREILKVLQRKWGEHNSLQGRMSELIREHGLSTTGFEQRLARSIGVERQEVSGADWLFANNDCVPECASMEDNSVDLIVTSIPFGNHYEYTSSCNDFGHNSDNAKFFAQMDFLTPNLLRILKPGRVAAIHVKDRVRFGNVTGYGRPSMEPFHAHTLTQFQAHGFIYGGMITVVTDVVRENAQTYRLGWSEQCKDGSKMGVGCNEYVLLFYKLPTDTTKGYADERVVKSKADYKRGRWQIDASGYWRSSGNRQMTADELVQYGPDQLGKILAAYTLAKVYDYDEHVTIVNGLDAKGALPSGFGCLMPGSHDPDVWTDVNRMLTLNGEQSRKGLEYHICPLQFDIVDRLINRYSSKGELIFDPFGGLVTVPLRALKLGRRGRAVELSTSYYLDGVQYLRAAEREMAMPDLFAAEELAA